MLGKLGLAAGILVFGGFAYAGPISNCTTDISGVTCNLYETDSGGNFSQLGMILTVPAPVTAGYVVFEETSGPPNTDLSNWEQVLVFTTTTVQLLTQGCNVAPGNTSCFPSYATVTGVSHVFTFEAATPPSVYAVSNRTYNIYGTVPEPASFSLLGLGLAGLAIARKRLAL